jgi:hypothetical protein
MFVIKESAGLANSVTLADGIKKNHNNVIV